MPVRMTKSSTEQTPYGEWTTNVRQFLRVAMAIRDELLPCSTLKLNVTLNPEETNEVELIFSSRDLHLTSKYGRCFDTCFVYSYITQKTFLWGKYQTV
jgi:hypothetical protein